MNNKQETYFNWLVTVSLGLIIGYSMVSISPTYHEYSVVIIASWLRLLIAVISGFVVTVFFGHITLVLIALLVLLSVPPLVPLISTVISAYLLNTTHLLDVMLFNVLRSIIPHFFSLLIMVVVGSLVAMGLKLDS